MLARRVLGRRREAAAVPPADVPRPQRARHLDGVLDVLLAARRRGDRRALRARLRPVRVTTAAWRLGGSSAVLSGTRGALAGLACSGTSCRSCQAWTWSFSSIRVIVLRNLAMIADAVTTSATHATTRNTWVGKAGKRSMRGTMRIESSSKTYDGGRTPASWRAAGTTTAMHCTTTTGIRCERAGATCRSIDPIAASAGTTTYGSEERVGGRHGDGPGDPERRGWPPVARRVAPRDEREPRRQRPTPRSRRATPSSCASPSRA